MEKNTQTSNDQNAQTPEQEEILSIDIVRNRVDYGTYIARLPDQRNNTCRAYSVLQKIYRQDDTEVKGYYRCSRCYVFLYVLARNGTGALNRHVEEKCEKLPPDMRIAARNARLGRVNKQADVVTVNTTSAIASAHPKGTPPAIDIADKAAVVNIKASDLVLALRKATEIGQRYGSKDLDLFADILKEHDNKWSNDIMDEARQQAANQAKLSAVRVQLPHIQVASSSSSDGAAMSNNNMVRQQAANQVKPSSGRVRLPSSSSSSYDGSTSFDETCNSDGTSKSDETSISDENSHDSSIQQISNEVTSQGKTGLVSERAMRAEKRRGRLQGTDTESIAKKKK